MVSKSNCKSTFTLDILTKNNIEGAQHFDVLNQCTLSVYFICESFNVNDSGTMSEKVSQRLATPVSYCTKCRWAQLWTHGILCSHSCFLPKSSLFLNNMYSAHFKFYKGSNNFHLVFIAFGNLSFIFSAFANHI